MILRQGDNRRCSGFVPRDAERRVTGSGKGVCSFSLKVGDREVNGNKEAIWQRCTVWEGSPFFDAAASIRKGDSVAVDGVIHRGSYQKSEGGEQITVPTEDLWCDWLSVARASQSRNPTQAAAKKAPDAQGFEEIDEDELPF